MRFHVVSLPHTQTTQEFSSCAFTENVRKFCIMMRDHTVFLYSGEQNEAPCTEHISCISEELRKFSVGNKHFSAASFDWTLPHWRVFNNNVINSIKERLQPQDFICIIGGLAQKSIADTFPNNIVVEFGVGYGGCFADYKVFESYAWMHTVYGAQQLNHNPNDIDGKWFDVVIPGHCEREKFTPTNDTGDYYLYMGRLIDRKGLNIAAEVCKEAKKRLIIAGPGDSIPEYGEYVGVVNPEQRNELMSKAIALLAPTIYIEPFGNVVVEAQMCGTPTITTDWGAFSETNENNVTGYRCRTFKEFLDSLEKVKHLNRNYIRERALNLFSLEAVAPQYDKYFRRLETLWNKGWYSL